MLPTFTVKLLALLCALAFVVRAARALYIVSDKNLHSVAGARATYIAALERGSERVHQGAHHGAPSRSADGEPDCKAGVVRCEYTI